MDDFEKAVLFSFDQSGVVDDGLNACAARQPDTRAWLAEQ